MRLKQRTIYLEGDLVYDSVPRLYAVYTRRLRQRIGLRRGLALERIDIAAVTRIDSAGLALIDEISSQHGTHCTVVGGSRQVTEAIDLLRSDSADSQYSLHETSWLERLGAWTLRLRDTVGSATRLSAEVFYRSVASLFRPRGHKRGAVVENLRIIGADAVGIVGLLSLIIGWILALQSAAQLRQFGANIFVADLLAISIVREMGPLMTAIIVAGRSGSAIASEIATMKVSDELDALRTMGIDPVDYVVVPKFQAMTIAMPLLASLSIVIGLLGGLIISLSMLDLTVTGYTDRVFAILKLSDLVTGLSKTVVFAWVIVIIGSYSGFHVSGGASGVGRATTQAVVASIFTVIVVDVIFSFTYL
ncbi:MAG: MlaE family lipid ABC transporter permease subunit [Spirochaetaceae bacterium]|nr:MAG: MlaE family lipid ABC transporter permease subunit [Spirochaetaceae bacterium]